MMNLCVQSPQIYHISSLIFESKLNLIELLVLINFSIAVFTDFLDGYLSRKWNATSDFGATYDPVADKAIIIGFFIFFACKDLMFRWIPILMIFRDVISDYIRIKKYQKNVVVPASKLAKWKTASQMFCIMTIMMFCNSENDTSWWISTLITLVPLIFSYVSFFQYIQNSLFKKNN